jgi:hypothetical protein
MQIMRCRSDVTEPGILPTSLELSEPPTREIEHDDNDEEYEIEQRQAPSEFLRHR